MIGGVEVFNISEDRGRKGDGQTGGGGGKLAETSTTVNANGVGCVSTRSAKHGQAPATSWNRTRDYAGILASR